MTEPYEDIRHNWMSFAAHLSDEGHALTLKLVEHGIHRLWMNVQLKLNEDRVRVLERKKNKERNRVDVFTQNDGTRPISMEFEIIGIFPISGYLLVIALAILLGECVHKWVHNRCGGRSRAKIVDPSETGIERTKSAGQISNDNGLQIQVNGSANSMTEPFGRLHQEPEAAGRIKTAVEIHREESMRGSAKFNHSAAS